MEAAIAVARYDLSLELSAAEADAAGIQADAAGIQLFSSSAASTGAKVPAVGRAESKASSAEPIAIANGGAVNPAETAATEAATAEAAAEAAAPIWRGVREAPVWDVRCYVVRVVTRVPRSETVAAR